MSIVLIHTIGFVTCSAVAVIGLKSLYHSSQNPPKEEDYLVEIPLEDRNVPADVLGLGIEIVRFGLFIVEGFTDKVFDSRLVTWLCEVCRPESNEEDEEDEFAGWKDEPQKYKPGRHEVEM